MANTETKLLCIKDFINWEGTVSYKKGEMYNEDEIKFVTFMLYGREEQKTFPKHFKKISKIRNSKIDKILK